jgi:hypothetical protein
MSEKNLPNKKKRPGSAKASETASSKEGSVLTTAVSEPKKLDKPYVIHLQNTTDEKLFNVKLFDQNFENQRKVSYSNEPREISYQQFLLQINNNNDERKMGRLQIIASGDYRKFVDKQLRCPLYLKFGSVNGNYVQIKENILISPYQQQTNMAVIETNFNFYSGIQIELEYLMPEVSVSLYIYPFVKEEKK